MTDKSSLLKNNESIDETSLGYMLRLSAPMVVTTLSFTIMQFVDRYMVSRLGTEALAAIWPAGLVSFIPGGFAMGALASLNTFVSQSLGRGEKKECSKYYWQAVYMGLIYFITVGVIMWPLAPLIFKIMLQPEAVIQMEVIYLRIMLYAHILAVINWSCNQFFMGIHRPIITMCASLCGQIVNIAANYVLIFGKFGFPAMGIAGAGWGTFIGITIAAVINMSIYLSPGINSIYQTRRSLKIDFYKMKSLLRVGLPTGFGLMLNVSLWGVILLGLIGRFGKGALAATGAVLSYTSLSVMPVVGISMALTAAVGKIIGQGKKELAVKQTDLCIKISLAYMGFMGICFLIFRDSLIGFLSSDDQVINAGVDIFVCAAVYQVFHAARIIYGGSLRGAGDTVWLAIISAIGAIPILGLGGYLIATFFPSLGAIGPWLAATLSVIVVGLSNRWRFKSNRWKSIDLFRRRSANIPVQTEPTIE
jgi:MATE family multidrug resistance protein